MADYGWGEGLRDAFQGLGWGSMFAASAQNPALQPGLAQTFLQLNNQPTVYAEQRRQLLGSTILNGLSQGTIDWAQAAPALQKLGFDTRGMVDPFGGMGEATRKFQDMASQFYQGGGAPQVPQANVGIQPSPLAGAAEMDRVPGQGYEGPPPTGGYGDIRSQPVPAAPPSTDSSLSPLVREETDAQGNKIKTYAGGQSITATPSGMKIVGGNVPADITATFTEPEKQQYQAAQMIMAGPRPTMADINAWISKSGVRSPKERAALTAYGQQLVKDDEERRNLAVKQTQTLIESARQRMTEAKTEKIDEPVGADKQGRTLYQRWIVDSQTRQLKKFGVPFVPEVPSTNVTQTMGEKTAEKLSVEDVLGEKGQAKYEGALGTLHSVEDMEQANRQGIIGGPGADARTFWANLTSPFASEADKDELARSLNYQTLGGKLVLKMLATRDLGSGNSVTNQDREFIERLIPRASYDIKARAMLLGVMKHYAQYEVDRHESKQAYLLKQQEQGRPLSLLGWKPPRWTGFVNSGGAKLSDFPAVQPQREPKADPNKPAMEYKDMFPPAVPMEQR